MRGALVPVRAAHPPVALHRRARALARAVFGDRHPRIHAPGDRLKACSRAAVRAGPAIDRSSRRAASRWSPVQITRTAVAVASPLAVAEVATDRIGEVGAGQDVRVLRLRRLGRRTRLAAKSPYQPVTASAAASSSSAGRLAVAGRATVAVPQVEHGIAGQPQADDAGDEARHLGQRHRLGATLGQVAAEGVVEPPRGRRGPCRLDGSAAAAWGAGVAPADPEADRAGEIPSARRVRLGQRLAERRRRPARPEEEADDEADGAPERDVLDPDDARSASPSGAMMLNRIRSISVNAAWPGGERDRRRRKAGEEDGERAAAPTAASCSSRSRRRTPGADDEPDSGAEQAADDALTGARARSSAAPTSVPKTTQNAVLDARSGRRRARRARGRPRLAGCSAARPSAARGASRPAPAPTPAARRARPGVAPGAGRASCGARRPRRTRRCGRSGRRRSASSWARKLGSSAETTSSAGPRRPRRGDPWRPARARRGRASSPARASRSASADAGGSVEQVGRPLEHARRGQLDGAGPRAHGRRHRAWSAVVDDARAASAARRRGARRRAPPC